MTVVGSLGHACKPLHHGVPQVTRRVLRAVPLACALAGLCQAQAQPTLRVEHAAGSAGERTVVRAEWPVQWRLSAQSEVRYLAAAEVGERPSGTPALDQTLRYTRVADSPRQGVTVSAAVRAGRVSALSVALDTLAAIEVPGSLGTLTSLWRASGTFSGSVRKPLGGRETGILTTQFDGSMGLGGDRELVRARQRSTISASWASHLSRNETRETRISLIDERRPTVAPLQSVAIVSAWHLRPRRALTLRATGGVQVARLATIAVPGAAARTFPTGDLQVGLRSPRRVDAALQLSTDIRLDGERAIARRQWSGEARGAWPLSPNWLVTARARQSVMTGNGDAQGTQSVELLATSSAWPGLIFDFGVRLLQTDAPESVARSVTSTSLRDVRAFASWTRSRR